MLQLIRLMPPIGRRRASLALLPLVAACQPSPVVWEEARSPSTATAAAPLAVAAAGPLGAVPPAPPTLPTDSAGALCPASVRVARNADASGAPQTWAAWWSVRPDSSAVLRVGRSDDDGRSWARTVSVDTLDRGVRGCARPAPAIAADSVNGYVHVAYFMEAPEGPGLFFSHLMDPRALFEPPVVVVYGDRPSAVSLATRGDTVAVAYEDPNGARPRIVLALSYTSGHLFDQRNVAVSDGNEIAVSPSVALDGRRLAVAWLRRSRVAVSDPPAVVVRTGTLR